MLLIYLPPKARSLRFPCHSDCSVRHSKVPARIRPSNVKAEHARKLAIEADHETGRLTTQLHGDGAGRLGCRDRRRRRAARQQ